MFVVLTYTSDFIVYLDWKKLYGVDLHDLCFVTLLKNNNIDKVKQHSALELFLRQWTLWSVTLSCVQHFIETPCICVMLRTVACEYILHSFPRGESVSKHPVYASCYVQLRVNVSCIHFRVASLYQNTLYIRLATYSCVRIYLAFISAWRVCIETPCICVMLRTVACECILHSFPRGESVRVISMYGPWNEGILIYMTLNLRSTTPAYSWFILRER